MIPLGFSVTDETLERAMKRLIGRSQEALLCAKAKRQRQMFAVAKAKRQLQSTQSERRSTPRFEKGLYFLICHLDFIDIIVFQQHGGYLISNPLALFIKQFIAIKKR